MRLRFPAAAFFRMRNRLKRRFCGPGSWLWRGFCGSRLWLSGSRWGRFPAGSRGRRRALPFVAFLFLVCEMTLRKPSFKKWLALRPLFFAAATAFFFCRLGSRRKAARVAFCLCRALPRRPRRWLAFARRWLCCRRRLPAARFCLFFRRARRSPRRRNGCRCRPALPAAAGPAF